MSQPTLKASATYKKQNGTLSLSSDRRTIFWTPVTPADAPPMLRVAASELTSKLHSSQPALVEAHLCYLQEVPLSFDTTDLPLRTQIYSSRPQQVQRCP
jgi:hypothetical protein